MDKNLKIVCFGEVLWDVFPDGEKIGGAPLNVALRLQNLGLQTTMISSVGADDKGKKIIAYLESARIDKECISINKEFPSGVVQVDLDDNGSATYKIKYPVAWDKIPLTTPMVEAVHHADAFIFGSLVCRDEVSRETLMSLITIAKFRVLDVNLRADNYSTGTLIELIKLADFIKFNDDELFEIAALFGSKYNSLEQNLQFIISKTNAKSICVTKGRHGAVLYHQEKLYYNSGFKIKVKDTVGAGDSFLATLISKIIGGGNPQKALDFACGVGALVASKEGGNPNLSPMEISTFIHEDKLLFTE